MALIILVCVILIFVIFAVLSVKEKHDDNKTIIEENFIVNGMGSCASNPNGMNLPMNASSVYNGDVQFCTKGAPPLGVVQS